MTASSQPPAGAPLAVRPAPGGPTDPAAGGSGPASWPGAMSFDMHYDTNPGKARAGHNEDAIWAAPLGHTASASRGYLFVVADGMGGHNAGEVASQSAVRAVYERFYGDTEPNIRRSLDRAIRQTNNELFNQAQTNPAQHGMGTTMTAAVLKGNKLHVAHVGDSRLYLIRNGQPEQVTHDHSWVEEQVRAGVLTRLQAESHPQRNVITRALATGPDVQVDYEERELQPGDVVVICSDGLNTEVGDTQIASLATKALNAQEAVQRLIQLANDNGGDDNISVAVIRVGVPAGATTAAAPSAAGKKWPIAAIAGGLVAVLALVGAAIFLLSNPPQRSASKPPPVPVSAPTATLAPEGVALLAVAATTAVPDPSTAAASAVNVGPTATLAATNEPIAMATNAPPTPAPAAPPLATVAQPTANSGIKVLGGGNLPGPTPTATRLAAPNQIAPQLSSTITSPEINFQWQPSGHLLLPGEGYAVLMWPASDANWRGKPALDLGTVHDACNPADPWRNLSYTYKAQEAGKPAGEYYWAVVIVNVDKRAGANGESCVVISELQSQPIKFNYSPPASRGTEPGWDGQIPTNSK